MSDLPSSENTRPAGKRGAKGIFFNHTFFVIFLLLLQVGSLVLFFTWLSNYSGIFLGFCTALGFFSILYIINAPMNPSYKLAWILPIAVFPVFGVLLFLFVKFSPSTIKLNSLHQKQIQKTSDYLEQNPDISLELKEDDSSLSGLIHYVSQYGGYPVWENTEVSYYPTGEDMFEAMIPILKSAKEFIFLEYFIIQNGYMWDTILDILKEKAAEGVEVRILYDGTNSVINLPYSYPKELKKYGIACKVFAQIIPILSIHMNNRDHRKICVVDGLVGMTGGINLADEYINLKHPYGYWKDTGIILNGDAVKNLTLMFLQMWNINETEKEENYSRYLKPDGFAGIHPGFVLPYGDSPVDHEPVGETVYLHLLQTARHYVHIVTPYLILDNEMITELCYAAKRGVDVHLLVPHIADKNYAFWLARSYYPQLLENGVKISEYTPGFVHAKMFIADGSTAVVGTINLDFRSLYLHFENAVLLYQVPAISDIEMDFQKSLKESEAIIVEDYKNFPAITRFLGALLKFIAPLL